MRRLGWIVPLLLILVATPLAAQQEVVFQRRAAQPGDFSSQSLDCDLDLTMSIRQGGQVVQAQQQKLKRHQQRELTVLEVVGDAPRRAKIKYQRSTVGLQSPEQEPQVSHQPVSGKAYLITREGDELAITYEDGSQPPDEERLLVEENMETFGLPNPIATFFHGKGVRVGQTLELPADLARDLLGFAATGNAVSHFSLTLAQIRPASTPGGSPQAVFQIVLKAEDPEQTGVTMTLGGQMLMEIETCRTLAVTLAGPVKASELHGPEGGQYELHSQGRIDVAVKADYRR